MTSIWFSTSYTKVTRLPWQLENRLYSVKQVRLKSNHGQSVKLEIHPLINGDKRQNYQTASNPLRSALSATSVLLILGSTVLHSQAILDWKYGQVANFITEARRRQNQKTASGPICCVCHICAARPRTQCWHLSWTGNEVTPQSKTSLLRQDWEEIMRLPTVPSGKSVISVLLVRAYGASNCSWTRNIWCGRHPSYLTITSKTHKGLKLERFLSKPHQKTNTFSTTAISGSPPLFSQRQARLFCTKEWNP